jgi:hypothetical protein
MKKSSRGKEEDEQQLETHHISFCLIILGIWVFAVVGPRGLVSFLFDGHLGISPQIRKRIGKLM